MNEPSAVRRRRPRVLIWFRVYCVLMALLGLVLLVVGFSVLFGKVHVKDWDPETAGIVHAAVGFVYVGAFSMAPFLPPRPKTWLYSLVLICMGMLSCALFPFCVALLIFWIRPNTQQYFGKTNDASCPPPASPA